MPKTLRDFLVAVSLSNLCFLWAWQTLSNPLHYSYYYTEGPGSITEPLGLFLDVLVLAGGFWVLVQLARRSKYRLPLVVGRWVFLLMLGVPIFTILHKREAASIGGEFDLPAAALIAIAAVAVLLLFGAYKWQHHVIKVAVTCVLILSPLVVINFVYSVWLLNKYKTPPNANQKRPLQAPNNGDKKHIVWIVFDELDQHVTFRNRPAGLLLPEFDRLRAESFFANNAYSPSRHTASSMPALITGRKVFGAVTLSPNEILLTFEGGELGAWSNVKAIFSEARENGFSTAVVGWYHPYCRVIGRSLDFCAWKPLADRPQNIGSGVGLLLQNMVFWIRHSFYRIPFLKVVRQARDSHQAIQHTEAYRYILTDGLKLASDPGWNVILIHFPIPHPPFIYDSQRRQLSTSGTHSFYDNVALADATLGQIRRAMESSQIWDQSTVLISADHWWRERPNRAARPDRRVPFILKLPGQKQGMVYEGGMNTVVTGKVLLGVLRGELSRVDDVRALLDQQPANLKIDTLTDVP